MGNQLAAPARVQPGELLATDVPNLVFKDSLGGGRFLKTFLTRHEEGQRGGLVVVKVYLKRGAPGTGGGLDPALVKEHERRLRRLRNALSSPAPTHLHAWPFQRELETDRAVYLMRQYAHSTLYDRVSTRPFLSHVEKKWMAYQLLHGLADCHERGIAHGDVKLENVLVTSWGWAFLTDFATFKPETLPADNPADYSFFFDTGGRRRCYVAPERFRDGAQGSPGDRRGAEASAASAAGSAGAPDASADPARDPSGADVRHGAFEETLSYDFAAADVFSLGCALGELFLDGSALFDLSQLLAYRRGEHDPSQQLQAVADRDARALVMAMLHRDPARRPTARAHLERWKSGGREPLGARADSKTEPFFPAYFETMHDFCASLMMKDADQTAEAVRAAFEPLLADIAREEGGVRERGRAPSPPGASPVPARPEASGDAAPATSGGGASPATEHMMRDIDAMMADIGNLLGDASDDAEKVPGNGDEMNGVTGGGASFEWFDRDGEPASDGEPTDSGGSISATAPAIRAATPEDAALIAEAVARGASLPGAVLVASVVCSCVRGAVRPSLRRDALGLLSRVAAVADDDARLQLIVPFCVASAADGAAAVRAAAVRALAETTRRVETFPASDAKVFPEFVWPSLSGLARDREESVRVAYAASLASLARASARFLQRANEGSEDAADGLSMSAYEDDLASLRALVRGAVLDYLTPGGSGGGGGRAETSSGGGDVAAGRRVPVARVRARRRRRFARRRRRGGRRGPRHEHGGARSRGRRSGRRRRRARVRPLRRRRGGRVASESRRGGRRRVRASSRDAASGDGEARRGPLLRGAHARLNVGRFRRVFSRHARRRRRRRRPAPARRRPADARRRSGGRGRARVVFRPRGRERFPGAPADHLPERPLVAAARRVFRAHRRGGAVRGRRLRGGVPAPVRRAVPRRRLGRGGRRRAALPRGHVRRRRRRGARGRLDERPLEVLES
jgi:phosphoinositide-3-kinase regulatory subunit 4